MKKTLQILALPLFLILTLSCENPFIDKSTSPVASDTVVTPVTGVTITAGTLILVPAETSTLSATVAPASATISTVTWTSSVESIATVSSTGLVTAVAVGEATITATTTDGSFTDTCVITVTPVTPVTGVTITAGTLILIPAETSTLSATVAPASATISTVTWTSSVESIATVNSTGLVTAVAVGEATITATTTDGSFTDTCVITVANPVTAVSLNKSTTSMVVLGTEQLTVTILPAFATEPTVTWTSSNVSNVTVSSTGLVTAVTAGSATITVTTNDGDFTDTCVITVLSSPVAVTGVSLIPSTLLINAEETKIIYSTITPATATNQNLTWSSSNDAVATVTEGIVTGISAGTTIITVTTNDGSFTATSTITVTIPVSGVSLNTTTTTIEKGATETLVATIAPVGASNSIVNWTSSATGIATVDNGEVTAVADGVSTITATTADGSFTATCIVTVETSVTAINLLVDWSDLETVTIDQNSGNLIQILVLPYDYDNNNISAATDATFTVVSSNTEVVTITELLGQYTMLGISPGTATITATSTNGGLTDTVTVTVIGDTTAPTLNYMMFIDDDTLYVMFSEVINTTDVENMDNYTVKFNNTTVAVNSVEVIQSTSNSIVYVNLVLAPEVGDEVSLTISPLVKDLSDNTISIASDGNNGFENILTLIFAPAHGLVLNTTDISQSAGEITLNTGAVDLSGLDPNFASDSIAIYALKEGDIISTANVIAFAYINSDGLSISPYTGNASALLDFNGTVASFPNGTYDLIICADYDIDGNFETFDDMTTKFGARVTYTVTTGS